MKEVAQSTRGVSTLRPEPRLILTVAARRIGVPYARLYAGVLNGEVNATRVGSRWYIAEADVAVVAQLLREPTVGQGGSGNA